MGCKPSLFEEYWLVSKAWERKGLPLGTARASANAGPKSLARFREQVDGPSTERAIAALPLTAKGATMKAKVYLQLAEVCERAAATADLPETKAGMFGLCCCVAPTGYGFQPVGRSRIKYPTRQARRPRKLGGAFLVRVADFTVFRLEELRGSSASVVRELEEAGPRGLRLRGTVRTLRQPAGWN